MTAEPPSAIIRCSMSETPTEKAKRVKRKFIEDALLEDAVNDALSQDWHTTTVRAVLKNGTKEERDKFRAALKEELRSLATKYEGIADDMGDDVHIKNIREMAQRLEKQHSGVLNEGRLYFGVAAKALNVYLKYLHCARFDVRPPHCPFDNGIINKLNPKTGIVRAWTRSDSEGDYREWVRLAKDAAERGGFESMTDWEAVTWDEQQNKPKSAATPTASPTATTEV